MVRVHQWLSALHFPCPDYGFEGLYPPRSTKGQDELSELEGGSIDAPYPVDLASSAHALPVPAHEVVWNTANGSTGVRHLVE